jgi:hypothetical protein
MVGATLIRPEPAGSRDPSRSGDDDVATDG